ncbi:hypothetical protein ElyMa_004065800 [Elysia marginata]|uniref:Uncharacterized protein n=1 Tax=Elysia marginata TaxID=1093978 RepID=A0AAV4G9L6_9GAST|nr:hypothetical protein ElyMa_004065800 [Elysia marginata]
MTTSVSNTRPWQRRFWGSQSQITWGIEFRAQITRIFNTPTSTRGKRKVDPLPKKSYFDAGPSNSKYIKLLDNTYAVADIALDRCREQEESFERNGNKSFGKKINVKQKKASSSEEARCQEPRNQEVDLTCPTSNPNPTFFFQD